MATRTPSARRDARRPLSPRAIPPAPLAAWYETALLALGFVLSCFLLPHAMSGDAATRYHALSALLRGGKLLPVPYSLIGPLFSIPLWLLGEIGHASVEWCLRYNLVLLAGGMVALYLLLRRQTDARLLRRFFLVLLVASMFPAHLLDYDGEVFTAVCVAAGSVALVVGLSVVAWLALVLGVANAPASVVGLALLVARRLLDTRRLRLVLLLAATAALILVMAWVQRGSPFKTGYEGNHGFRTILPYSGLPGFSYPPLLGLLSILFSFGKGLIFFAPGLLLPVRRRLRSLAPNAAAPPLARVYTLWLSFVVGLVIAYMSWWAWYGGWFWGPRFFLFASIPASFALALWLSQPGDTLLANVGVLLVLGLSLWVGIDGAVFGQQTLGPICQSNNYAREYLCWYVPEFSPLWRPFVVHARPNTAGIVYSAYSVLVGATLAIPLLQRTVRLCGERLASMRGTYLRPGAWRL